jgi:hypothetical protein
MPGESNPSLTAVEGYGDTALIVSYWLVNMARLLDDRQLTRTSPVLSPSGVELHLCVPNYFENCKEFNLCRFCSFVLYLAPNTNYSDVQYCSDSKLMTVDGCHSCFVFGSP